MVIDAIADDTQTAVSLWGSSNQILERQVLSMISVQGVSMRFGSKILFDDVTTTFSAGRRYGLTGPNGRREVDVHEAASLASLQPQRGTVVRPAKIGVLRQDQLRSTNSASATRSSWANERLWNALEERELLYARPR